jgi:hypothetical protein
MKHKVLLPIQKEWIGWLLTDGRDWMDIHVESKDTVIHLNWSWVNGVYDMRTEQLLNLLLNRFNEDEEIRKQWQLSLEWNKANVI